MAEPSIGQWSTNRYCCMFGRMTTDEALEASVRMTSRASSTGDPALAVAAQRLFEYAELLEKFQPTI